MNRKNLVVAGMAAAVCIGIVSLLYFGADGQKRHGKAAVIPEQAIEHFSVSETEGGKPHWVLDADSAQILESQKKVLLDAPVIKFFEKGEYVSTLVAKKGRINTENYDIWGDGECTLDTVKGEHLETANLYYNSATKIISTDEKVMLKRPDETIYGEGMEATPDLETIKIKKQRVLMDDKKDK